MGYHAGTFTPSDLPVDAVLAQLAFSYSDYFVTALAITDMNMTDPEALEQWNRNGVVYGGGYSTVPYSLMCTTEIKTLADLKGKRVRMPGSAHSNWATSVGAVPVNVPSSEMYGGLEKGQLDCAANGANELKTRSLWEVAKYVTLARLGVYYSGFEYGFNKDFWTKLSADDRRAILDSIAVAMVRTGIGYRKVADDILTEAPSHGVDVVEPADDLSQSVSDYAAKAREDAITLGKDQFKLDDPEGLIVRFEERIAKWQKLLEGVDQSDEAQLTALVKRELFHKIDAQTYRRRIEAMRRAPMVTFVSRLAWASAAVCSGVAALSLLLMMMQTVVDIVLRSAFNRPIEGNLEVVSLYHMVAVVFLPLALVELKHEHISVDMFLAVLPQRISQLVLRGRLHGRGHLPLAAHLPNLCRRAPLNPHP